AGQHAAHAPSPALIEEGERSQREPAFEAEREEETARVLDGLTSGLDRGRLGQGKSGRAHRYADRLPDRPARAARSLSPGPPSLRPICTFSCRRWMKRSATAGS